MHHGDDKGGLAPFQIAHQMRKAQHLVRRIKADAQFLYGVPVQQRPMVARIYQVYLIARLIQYIGDENSSSFSAAASEGRDKYRNDLLLIHARCLPKIV